MKILHLTNMYPDESRPFWGTFVRNQVETLRRLGIECTVHLVDGQASRLNYLREISRIHALLKADRYDILHIHYGLTGLVALGQNRLPIVLSLYGSDVNIWWQRWVSRWAARRAVRTIVCSQRMATDLRTPKRPLILPPGIDIEHYSPRNRAAARTRLGCAPNETVLFFPGNPNRAVKDYPLFTAMVDKLRCDNVRIFTLGNVADADLPFLYSAADCVVMTSRTEGSPTVIKEALACGCPAVSVDVGDVAEQICGHAQCFVTRTREPGEIAARVTDVLGRERPAPTDGYLEGVSLVSVGRRLIEVYREILLPD